MKKKRKVFQLLLALMLVFIMSSGRAAFAEEMTIAGPAAPKETAAKESAVSAAATAKDEPLSGSTVKVDTTTNTNTGNNGGTSATAPAVTKENGAPTEPKSSMGPAAAKETTNKDYAAVGTTITEDDPLAGKDAGGSDAQSADPASTAGSTQSADPASTAGSTQSADPATSAGSDTSSAGPASTAGSTPAASQAPSANTLPSDDHISKHKYDFENNMFHHIDVRINVPGLMVNHPVVDENGDPAGTSTETVPATVTNVHSVTINGVVYTGFEKSGGYEFRKTKGVNIKGTSLTSDSTAVLLADLIDAAGAVYENVMIVFDIRGIVAAAYYCDSYYYSNDFDHFDGLDFMIADAAVTGSTITQTDPGTGTDPGDPNNPGDPTNPNNPGGDDPGTGTDPGDPTNPNNPGGGDPGTGTDPGTPTTPNNPGGDDPGIGKDPGTPTNPANPETPAVDPTSPTIQTLTQTANSAAGAKTASASSAKSASSKNSDADAAKKGDGSDSRPQTGDSEAIHWIALTAASALALLAALIRRRHAL